jgi:hypothetical protein
LFVFSFYGSLEGGAAASSAVAAKAPELS